MTTTPSTDYINQLEEANEALKTTLENISANLQDAETKYIPHWEEANCSYDLIRDSDSIPPKIRCKAKMLVFGKFNFDKKSHRNLIMIRDANAPYIPAFVVKRTKIKSNPTDQEKQFLIIHDYDYVLFIFNKKHRGSFKSFEAAQARAEALLFGRMYLSRQ